mmetsp:Transcript_33682/g.77718  ORF Transcript_33682/g.77718 Transcript_33682/m.77718 type:complete len:114 (-) Transcript_33682:1604-1945(-)
MYRKNIGQDNDHANLLLCEGCHIYQHTYCIDPPLRKVPDSDWYCEKCKRSKNADGLDDLILALPLEVRRRFGEICFAQGGSSFGWWPAIIYDPLLTVGSARKFAAKHPSSCSK